MSSGQGPATQSKDELLDQSKKPDNQSQVRLPFLRCLLLQSLDVYLLRWLFQSIETSFWVGCV
jgi:hypothetical protein